MRGSLGWRDVGLSWHLDREAVVLDRVNDLLDAHCASTHRFTKLLSERALVEKVLRHVWPQERSRKRGLAEARFSDEHDAKVDPRAPPFAVELLAQAEGVALPQHDFGRDTRRKRDACLRPRARRRRRTRRRGCSSFSTSCLRTRR